MKIALLTSSYVANHGGLERHVRALADGLAQRGAEVELLAQRSLREGPRVSQRGGVTVRSFPIVTGPLRFTVAPGLWDRLRLGANSFDLADVHCADARLALAVIRAGFQRCVFTPHVPIQRVLGWPHARTTAAVIAGATEIVCNSSFERDALCERFPTASHRVSVVPVGVDAEAIRAASPFEHAGNVVLAVGRLERSKRIDRAIAAMASLDPGLRLVVVGNGPALHRLRAHAADLRLSSRVQFVGRVADAELYRWLRSARVVVALHEDHSSGIHLTEALAAGAPVVASEIPVHREAAARFHGARVKFVSPRGSPFEVADGIAELARTAARPALPKQGSGLPSEDLTIDRVWDLYDRMIHGADQIPRLPRTHVA
jgi:glycosyltransferase involved in cell wall biosynthesis